MDGGAQEAMQYCVLNEVRERARSDNASPNIQRINYIKKNKIAVEKGLVNAREQAACSKELEKAYLITPPTLKSNKNSPGSCGNDRAIKNTDMTFGISTRPSTPVFELLEHHYQMKWLQHRQKKQRQMEECAKKAKGRSGIKNTQANYQKQAKITQNLRDNDSKQYHKSWQMNKWKKIGASLNTFRSDSVRETSMAHHYETMNTRQGIFGHGNYIE